MPDEDKTLSGSFVLNLRIWWRQAHTLYISTHLFLPGGLHKYRDAPPLADLKTITDDVTLTLPYITWHYLTFPFEISSPFTKISSCTRLYNAAASPASRLRSAGSLAIIRTWKNSREGSAGRSYLRPFLLFGNTFFKVSAQNFHHYFTWYHWLIIIIIIIIIMMMMMMMTIMIIIIIIIHL